MALNYITNTAYAADCPPGSTQSSLNNGTKICIEQSHALVPPVQNRTAAQTYLRQTNITLFIFTIGFIGLLLAIVGSKKLKK